MGRRPSLHELREPHQPPARRRRQRGHDSRPRAEVKLRTRIQGLMWWPSHTTPLGTRPEMAGVSWPAHSRHHRMDGTCQHWVHPPLAARPGRMGLSAPTLPSGPAGEYASHRFPNRLFSSGECRTGDHRSVTAGRRIGVTVSVGDPLTPAILVVAIGVLVGPLVFDEIAVGPAAVRRFERWRRQPWLSYSPILLA